ncbi:hypothetical protein [Streptomyces sp. NPDC001537]
MTVTVEASGAGEGTDGRLEAGVRVCVTDGGRGRAGLGLPPARRLARSTGGEASHDLELAPGARFVVGLPSG